MLCRTYGVYVGGVTPNSSMGQFVLHYHVPHPYHPKDISHDLLIHRTVIQSHMPHICGLALTANQPVPANADVRAQLQCKA